MAEKKKGGEENGLMKFDKLRVLRSEDREILDQFEVQKIQEDKDPLGFMKSWSAPWRSESLDHYLNLGWSMGYFEGESVQGYILAQPLLFFRGHTQSLWLETLRVQSVSGTFNDNISQTLFEALVKVSKEKHLQQVLFHRSLLEDFKCFSQIFERKEETFQDKEESYIQSDQGYFFIKTTKWEK